MKKLILAVFTLTVFNLFAQRLTDYVNPFIGTGGHGHTFPGATVPFGMVQLSPDTDIKGWDWCSGYHYSDSTIMGFSHLHLSGTGAADYGDVMFMPFTGEIKFNAGTKENPDAGYRSRFSHSSEVALPGYYSVYLKDYKIKVELTATKRTGFQKYTVYKSGKVKVILDLVHGISDKATKELVQILNKNSIQGFRTSHGWAREHTVYFFTQFSKPFEKFELFNGKKILDNTKLEDDTVKAVFIFPMKKGESLVVRTGISHTSLKGARKNLQAEGNTWDFETVRKNALSSWEKELSRIKVEGSQKDKRIFYTAFYHTMIHPNVFNDVDGNYIGMDGQVHNSKRTVYTVFSLWDTFRALHPLFTLIDKKRTSDFVNTLLLKYKHSGHLPVWELAANETWVMIGYHSVPVIVDAYFKDVRNFNVNEALKAMVEDANKDSRGLKYYKQIGFCPMDSTTDAVSKTLEYAYDDWCIARLAGKLNDKKDYDIFLQRAQNYKNVFDTTTKFMRGRKFNGLWKTPFDPADASPLGAGEFTEGNSWQYTWFVPQDVQGLIKLMGGDKPFVKKLDALFNAKIKNKSALPSDVTGLIGQYAHGNEPSHHIAYLYDYAGAAWKTQEKVRQILNELYSDKPDGLPGNEDCGQMSAWYVFSALGFYPVTPGSDYYAIGSPVFKKAVIKLENGKEITIKSNNYSPNNIFVKELKINGEQVKNSFLKYGELKNGADIVFEMAKNPNKSFGAKKDERPLSEINWKFVPSEERCLFQPFINGEATMFGNSREVRLGCVNKNAEIHYTLDGSVPTLQSPVYLHPFVIKNSLLLQARAFARNFKPSPILKVWFFKAINRNLKNPWFEKDGVVYPTIRLVNKYSAKYTGGRDYALIDGVLGSKDFHGGHWQGFQKDDLIAIVDLGKPTKIKRVSIRFLENQGSWIFFPKKVEFYTAGKNGVFRKLKESYSFPVKPRNEVRIKRLFANVGKEIRFIKIKAENVGLCPKWHWGYGGGAWIFSDEIIIEQ